MTHIPWSIQINFASALLLHSCIIILIKEFLNWTEIAWRIFIRRRRVRQQQPGNFSLRHTWDTSAVLDSYTSIFSSDVEGEQAELYFTNTGFLLLAISLVSSVTMNLFLPSLVLNLIVSGTFSLCFIASALVIKDDFALPFMALRRAGRFIWSDTPFVNFFTLIYIATALGGRTVLRLQDYVTFRSIAVFELLFMKAKLAASGPEKHKSLIRRLRRSRRIIIPALDGDERPASETPLLNRDDILAFSTSQRLGVMFLKTSIIYDRGSLAGRKGPIRCPLPAVGYAVLDATQSCKVCRVSQDVIILADLFSQTRQSGSWPKVLQHANGALLRRLGKVRVVYIIKAKEVVRSDAGSWYTNANIVTGVTATWLDSSFKQGTMCHDHIVVE